MARNHQYVSSHVTNQHLCVWWIVETDIIVHVIDQMQDIALDKAKHEKTIKIGRLLAVASFTIGEILPSVYHIHHL